MRIGGDAEFLIDAPHNLITGAQTLTLSDRPELRIDPTTLVSTGALAGVPKRRRLTVRCFFWYNVDRGNLPGLSSVKFCGGYAQASWVLTGETTPIIRPPPLTTALRL
jgi:phosphate-selective porin OprO/OprP